MSAKPTSNINVVFGSMTIGAPGDQSISQATTHEAAAALLDVFQKHGHCEVDTARIYGSGTTEEYLAAVGWQQRGFKMETKFFPTKGMNLSWACPEELSHSATDLRKALNDSLKALNTDKFYMFYLHAPDRSVSFEDTLREVNKIHSEGVFERFGLSNFMLSEVEQICEICKRNGWVMPTGISFYAVHPLAGGFLTSRYTRDQSSFSDNARFDPARIFGKMLQARYWNDATFTALELLRAAIAPHGIGESEAALRWLAHHSALKKEFGDAVIVGAGSVAHLEANLEALEKGPLPVDVVKALDAGWEHTRELLSRYWH
ncbi:NADP-dependent oxidoreductase domain-containing protein [Mycena rosella]|uniref:NADP-dependent oxidoreductase domain-containing protein n=1 Tax=Mycena rosella TaxID=1033263 RepID=A0AAD7GE81_MYCRO|nr:NADP-dependent oxidoreductase domain-containing protein [Mycena rosella]